MSETEFFGEGARFHHIGLAVHSINSLAPVAETFLDPIQKVSVGFINISGAQIELIEPAGHDSPISRSLEKGVKLVHLCFSVPSITDALKAAKKFGFTKISKIEPAIAFNMKNIVWVYHSSYGLFELVED